MVVPHSSKNWKYTIGEYFVEYGDDIPAHETMNSAKDKNIWIYGRESSDYVEEVSCR